MDDESESVWKEKASWPNRGTMTEISRRDLRKPQKISVRIAGVPAEARAEHLPNTVLLHQPARRKEVEPNSILIEQNADGEMLITETDDVRSPRVYTNLCDLYDMKV
jgi:hypothetical protein